MKGVLHSFSIKTIFYDKMDVRLFYFHVTNRKYGPKKNWQMSAFQKGKKKQIN